MPTPRKRKTPAPPTNRRPPSRLEYRSPSDGAWYGVRVALQGGALRVMYEEFREETDDWYDPTANFVCARDVAALRARFRAPSPVLDDARCRDLRPGTPLCVACAFVGGDLQFYDAVLKFVTPAPHDTVDGEERCACLFSVQWAEGPRTGGWAEIGIEKICCVQSLPVQDPVLNEFLDVVTKSLGNGEGNATASQATGITTPEDGGGGTASGQDDLK